MRFLRAAGLLFLSLPSSNALIGYGISMYNPLCAFACRSSIEGAMLSCSEHDHGGGHSMHGGGGTTPECRAGDTSFLTTLAYCISTHCDADNVPAWKREKYWADKTTGDKTVLPKWTYAQALVQVDGTPEKELGEDEMLDFTAKVDEETHQLYRNTLEHFEYAETRHSAYGIALLVTGFATPIVLTLLGYLPFMTGLLARFKPYLYQSLIGKYNVQPLPYLLGNAPTVGQTVYIVFFVILNVILTAVGYKSTQPNMWFASLYQEIMGYVSARTGVLAFALAPLVILFSGRNNFLLWVTNWSHSTYMLLHRWVARLFGIQVILHSITELALYIDMGEFEVETKQPYWIWGIVATLMTVFMLVVSGLYFRRMSYEIFLITHIVMAVFVIAGSWYHVELLFTRKWGYELWLYAACAVWFFDRLLRVFRILKTGIRRSTVSQVSEDIVRIDVRGLRWAADPGRHTYAYFPTLNPLRPWENHPFSIVPTAFLRPVEDASKVSTAGSSSASAVENAQDLEKSAATATISIPSQTTTHHNTSGITLYVRKSTGLTKFLQSSSSLITLLDGPYPNNHTKSVLTSDRLLLIAGGIGITGILPFISQHTNVKLYWSLKESSAGLVTELENTAIFSGLREKEVSVGSRLNLSAILEAEESIDWTKIGVVVCGPGGLCDDVRALIATRGKAGKGVTWELEVDAFSW